METIRFSFNWNNKLTNKAFTTLRLHNEKKYKIGQEYRITLKEKEMGTAMLREIRHCTVFQLNDFITYLDTSYNAAETIKLLKTMYKARDIDWETQLLDFCLLVYKEE